MRFAFASILVLCFRWPAAIAIHSAGVVIWVPITKIFFATAVPLSFKQPSFWVIVAICCGIAAALAGGAQFVTSQWEAQRLAEKAEEKARLDSIRVLELQRQIQNGTIHILELQDTLERTRAEVELQGESNAPLIIDSGKIISMLHGKPKGNVEIWYASRNVAARDLALLIERTLRRASWRVRPAKMVDSIKGYDRGREYNVGHSIYPKVDALVTYEINPDSPTETIAAQEALRAAIEAGGVRSNAVLRNPHIPRSIVLIRIERLRVTS